MLEIPLVHFSVELWRSLHQEASVAAPDGDVKIDGLMLFTLFVGIVAFTLLYVWLVHAPPAGAGHARTRSTTSGSTLALAERRGRGSRAPTGSAG